MILLFNCMDVFVNFLFVPDYDPHESLPCVMFLWFLEDKNISIVS